MNIYDENMNIGRKDGCTDTEKMFFIERRRSLLGGNAEYFFPVFSGKRLQNSNFNKESPNYF